MIPVLVLGLTVGTGAFAVSALVWSALDRPVRLGHLVAGGVLELLVLLQAGIALVKLIGGDHPASVPTFVGYLLGSLIVLPLGVL